LLFLLLLLLLLVVLVPAKATTAPRLLYRYSGSSLWRGAPMVHQDLLLQLRVAPATPGSCCS